MIDVQLMKNIVMAGILFAVYFFMTRRLKYFSKRIFHVSLLSILIKFANAIYLQKIVYGFFYESGDTNLYDEMGRTLLSTIKANPLLFIGKFLIQMPMGTDNMFSLTGILYYLMGGPSLEGAAVIAAFVSSVGAYLFFRAYCMHFPGTSYKIFGYLIFLFPSILFWTSLQLKEAWVFFCLGLATFGISSLFSKRILRGILATFLGVYFGFHLKPHIFLFFICALPFLVIWSKKGAFWLRMSYKLALLSLIIFSIIVLFPMVKTRFVGEKEIFGRLAYLKQAGAVGGSSVSVRPLLSISDWPNFFINAGTVLFRPFFFEAHNALEFVSGLEGIILGVLFMRSVMHRSRKYLRNKFYVFALFYVLIFTAAFSFQVGNLGTMVRVRVLMLPFLFIIFSCHLAGKNKLGLTHKSQGIN